MPDGTVYQTNYITTISYHVGRNNHEAIGVAFAGNFVDHPPTDQQVEMGRKLIRCLREQYELENAKVMPHSAYPGANTQCPGGDWWHALEQEEQTPVVVRTPKEVVEDAVRDAAWRMVNVPLNPDCAFVKEARKRNLGAPLSRECDITVGDRHYRLQAFSRGILYARLFVENGRVVGGDWENVELISW